MVVILNKNNKTIVQPVSMRQLWLWHENLCEICSKPEVIDATLELNYKVQRQQQQQHWCCWDQWEPKTEWSDLWEPVVSKHQPESHKASLHLNFEPLKLYNWTNLVLNFLYTIMIVLMLKIILYFQLKMRSSGVLLLSTLVVGSFSRPQQDQNLNYEMELQGGRELMDIENVS